MDTAEIEVFLVLAEELHFGRTAERLRLPQPRVSRLVAALERRAGGALFERTSRRVRLTPLGQQLASQLRPAYAQLTEAYGEKVIPYWRAEAPFAAKHGVRVAIEMHPGFVVYNPASLLRLRAAAGDNLGANFDPSHLFWQGIDPVEAIASRVSCFDNIPERAPST